MIVLFCAVIALILTVKNLLLDRQKKRDADQGLLLKRKQYNLLNTIAAVRQEKKAGDKDV